MKAIVLITGLLFANTYLFSQINTITTAVPFLEINSSTQTSGMGDIGVVAPDQYTFSGLSQNPALLSRNRKIVGSALDFTPRPPGLANDIFLINAGGYINWDSLNAFGISMQYFNLGEITWTNNSGQITGSSHPYEFTTGVKYARTLSDKLSLGVGVNYILSDLAAGQTVNGITIHAAKSIAFDVGVDYRHRYRVSDKSSIYWDKGMAILHAGTKITYTDSPNKDFIPTILKLGTLGSFKTEVADQVYFSIDISYQVDKLLVPSPDTTDADNDGIYDYKTKSVIDGMIGSFGDAPNGFKEEMQELMHHFGVEGRVNIGDVGLIALRLGHFNEHKNKGNRKYVTIGISLGYLSAYLDFSYLLPFLIQRSPLDNTLGIGAGFRKSF